MKIEWSIFLLLAACIGRGEAVVKDRWHQEKFIIYMWCPPPNTDEQLQTLARDGYDLTSLYGGSEESDPVPDLNKIQQYGLKSLIANGPLMEQPGAVGDPVKRAHLDTLIDKVKDHPAFYGYFLKDEPGAGAFPYLKELSDYIRARDPNHLVLVNLFPIYANQQQLGVFLDAPPPADVGIPDNFAGKGASKDMIVFYREYLRQFIQELRPQMLSYDHYHFLKDGSDGLLYFLNLDMIRTAAVDAGIPFMNIVQACTTEKSWRLVNVNEERWLAYTTVVYGGRGICWFIYWGPKEWEGLYQDGVRSPSADAVASVNQEIEALGPELMQLTSTGVYHSRPLPLGTRDMSGSPVTADNGEYIVGMFKSEAGDDAFMIVNRDYRKESTAEITLKLGAGTLQEFILDAKQWQTLQTVDDGTRIQVQLRPGAGKLFRLIR